MKLTQAGNRCFWTLDVPTIAVAQASLVTCPVRLPALLISLEQDARFLNSPLDGKGPEWLQAGTLDAATLYGMRMERGKVSLQSIERNRETLLATTESMEEEPDAELSAIL